MNEYVIVLSPEETIAVLADGYLVKSEVNIVVFSVKDDNVAVFNMNNIIGFYCDRKF